MFDRPQHYRFEFILDLWNSKIRKPFRAKQTSYSKKIKYNMVLLWHEKNAGGESEHRGTWTGKSADIKDCQRFYIHFWWLSPELSVIAYEIWSFRVIQPRAVDLRMNGFLMETKESKTWLEFSLRIGLQSSIFLTEKTFSFLYQNVTRKYTMGFLTRDRSPVTSFWKTVIEFAIHEK
jgi:hypothetical protein